MNWKKDNYQGKIDKLQADSWIASVGWAHLPISKANQTASEAADDSNS